MATIVVPTDYPTIQGAVDAASSGDTIDILDGNYEESVYIDKDNIKLIGQQNVIIDGTNVACVGIRIKADRVEIKNLKIIKHETGILLLGNDTLIEGCIILSSVRNAIEFIGNENIFRNNSIALNNVVGIRMAGNENIIHNNTFDDNFAAGISFLNGIGVRNKIYSNTISGSTVCISIMSTGARENMITNNLLRKADFGVGLFNKDNIVKGNVVLDNSCAGVWLVNDENQVSNNIIQGNVQGVIATGDKNMVANNSIVSSGSCAVTANGSENTIKENVVANNLVGITDVGIDTIMAANTFFQNKKNILN